jgi:hypothetical protein
VRVFGIIIYDSLRPPKHRRKTSKSKIKAAKAKVEEASETNYKQKTDTENETDGIVKDELVKDEIVKDGIAKARIGVKDLIEESIQKEEAESEYIKADGIFSKAYKKVKARIISFIQKIKDKLKELIQKFINTKNKFNLIHTFIKDDINKEGFRFTYGTLKNLIKHVLPRKVKSRLIFGTGDPCSTGQALGVFGILYSIYGDSLQITPDFENKVFKGNHYVRGRIRIWTILIIVIKLLLDKRFKELKMNYQLLKEAL